jgi:hypothetical protein
VNTWYKRETCPVLHKFFYTNIKKVNEKFGGLLTIAYLCGVKALNFNQLT